MKNQEAIFKDSMRRETFDRLLASVREAIADYDQSNAALKRSIGKGDHLRHAPGEDCVRCNLERVLNGELR